MSTDIDTENLWLISLQPERMQRWQIQEIQPLRHWHSNLFKWECPHRSRRSKLNFAAVAITISSTYQRAQEYE